MLLFNKAFALLQIEKYSYRKTRPQTFNLEQQFPSDLGACKINYRLH